MGTQHLYDIEGNNEQRQMEVLRNRLQEILIENGKYNIIVTPDPMCLRPDRDTRSRLPDLRYLRYCYHYRDRKWPGCHLFTSLYIVFPN